MHDVCKFAVLMEHLKMGSFGRLVNDEHKAPNCRMKLIEAEGKPHLCLFALKEITAGTEIT